MANDEKDLKEGKETTPPATSGQGGKQGGEGSGDGETVTISKAELEQIKSDRDNYKTGLLAKKASERSGSNPKDGEDEEGKDSKGTDETQLDSGNVRNVAKEVFEEESSKTRKALQTEAHSKILELHPEYADDNAWNRALAHLHLTGQEVTVEDFQEKIEDAIFLDQKKQGKLDSYMAEQAKHAEQEGRNKAHQESVMNAGGNGDNRAPTQTTPLTPAREAMARKFKHDPVEVAKIPKQRKFTIDKP